MKATIQLIVETILFICLILFLTLCLVYPSRLSEKPPTGFSEDETCLMVALFLEARGEPLNGIKAVMQVIENRARKNNETICETIKKPKQFSFMNTGKVKMKVDYTKYLLYNSVQSLDSVVSEDTMYYHTKDIRRSWDKKLVKEAVIGHHIFYKEK